jgi:hypothetical protein
VRRSEDGCLSAETSSASTVGGQGRDVKCLVGFGFNGRRRVRIKSSKESMQVKMNFSFVKTLETVILKKIDFKQGRSICQRLLH